MNVRLQHLIKRFDQSVIVNDTQLEIHSGEMFFLLGPSGCGKTTILRMLAGFYDPEEGDIFFGDRRMNGVPPYARNTALVFQNYAVWPHLTVFENVAYGLRVRKVPAAELEQRVVAALEHVKMLPLRERKPPSLSGGQQQRVALARAMVVKPDLLLFDEPLCNLDAKLRIEMRDEIKRLHTATKITSLYVTHDQEEALSLATRLAVMHQGKIQQVGTPFEVYNHPANTFVASFIGEVNLFPASSPLAQKLGVTPQGQISFRPEHVKVVGSGTGIKAKVLISTYLGSKNQMILVTPEGEEFKGWTTDYIAEGTEIEIQVEPQHRLHFDADGKALAKS
jgi:ABC-type Fe3+/spermidine/putrescine transport system ATPase subunit